MKTSVVLDKTKAVELEILYNSSVMEPWISF